MKHEARYPVWPLAAACTISVVLLGLSSGVIVVPAILVALLASYMVLGAPRLPEPRAFLTLLIAVPFALWWRYGVEMTTNTLVPVTVLYVVGLYMMALATHHVLATGRGGNADYALACAVMGVGMAGTAETNPWYLPLLGLFLALVLLDLRLRVVSGAPGGRRRVAWGRYGAAVAALVALALVVDVFGIQQAEKVNQWLVQRVLQSGYRPNHAGFDRDANLNSISRFWQRGSDQQVALRVFADEAPEPYLRGAAYNRYGGGVWQIMPEETELAVIDTAFGRNVFNAGATDAGRLLGVVHPASGFTDAFFIPASTHQISTFSRRAFASTAGTMRPEESGAAGGYAFYAPTAPPLPPNASDTELPAYLHLALGRHADNILGLGNTPRDKIARAIAYFNANYGYALGVTFNGAADPIVSFLEQAHEGHCEYFAAATALLLRRHDIPARYVTGFVCDEPGLGGGYWLARRRNAHAWVEAWVDNQWVIVEATPGNARPAPVFASTGERFMEWLKAQWQRTVGMLTSGGLGAAVDWLVSLPGRAPTYVWVIFTAMGVAWVFRAEIRAVLGRRQGLSTLPHVRRLQMQLAEAERLLARHGVRRRPGETVGSLLRQLHDAPQLPDPVREQASSLLDEYQRERFRNAGV